MIVSDLINYPTEVEGREGKSALPAFKLIYLCDFLIKRESLLSLYILSCVTCVYSGQPSTGPVCVYV